MAVHGASNFWQTFVFSWGDKNPFWTLKSCLNDSGMAIVLHQSNYHGEGLLTEEH